MITFAAISAFFIKYKKILMYLGLALLILLLVFSIKSYFTKQPKIDLESINKINSANEKERKAELEKIIVKNSDVIQTADNRSLITQQNIETKNIEIENKIKAVDIKIAEVKAKGEEVTSEYLENLLLGNPTP